MDEAILLFERAARCRDIAQDYHPDLAAPLFALADSLEARAQRLQPRMAAAACAGRTD